MTLHIARLRRAARWVCDDGTMERVIEPLLSDLQLEQAAAADARQLWRSRWILLAGSGVFLKTILLCGIENIIDRRQWTGDDRAAVRGVLVWSTLIATVATTLLILPVVTRQVPSFAALPPLSVLTVVLALVPQAVALSVPIGFTFGPLLAQAGRRASTHSRRALIVWAVACSFASFLNLGWVNPAANDAYRHIIYNVWKNDDPEPSRALEKGMNELSLTEIRQRIAATRTQLDARGFDAPRRIRQYRYAYHQRIALALATLFAGGLALSLAPRLRRRSSGALIAVAICFGYYVLLWLGNVGAKQLAVPAIVGAWLPNVVLAVAWLAARTRVTSSRPVSF